MPDLLSTYLLSTYRPSLGGSEPDALLDQIADARSAVSEAACKVQELDIHMRDYQGRVSDYYAELARRAKLVETLQAVADALSSAALCVRNHVD
jgi:hypothetical protein